MLQNAYFLAKIGADTAENKQHFAEFCQKLATTLVLDKPQALENHGPAHKRGKLNSRTATTCVHIACSSAPLCTHCCKISLFTFSFCLIDYVSFSLHACGF